MSMTPVRFRLALTLLLGPASVPLYAQAEASGGESAAKRAWEIVPKISISETLTDNVLLSNANKQSELITQFSPSINITANSARVKGFFEYSRHELIYGEGTRGNTSQNQLNTKSLLEIFEDHLFLDISSRISQQTISAVGTPSPSLGSINPNQVETTNLQVSPYLKGRVNDLSTYELRYLHNSTTTQNRLTSDISTDTWSLKLGSARENSRLNWDVLLDSSYSEYNSGVSRERDQGKLVLSYTIDQQYSPKLILGQEYSNYLSADKKRYNNSGVGFDWHPSERTKLSITGTKEIFGSGHALTFEHRTPLSSWKLADKKSVSMMSPQVGTNSRGTLYDLFYSQFASQEPDPVKRDALVEQYLSATGLPADQIVNSGFLSSSISVERRQELSAALIGSRNSLTAQFQNSESERLGVSTGAGDAFVASNQIRQRGASLNWGYKLTPYANLNLTALYSTTNALSVAQSNEIQTTRRSLMLGVSTKLGVKTTGTLTVRRAEFDSTTNPYTENALVGSLVTQF